MFRFLLIIFFSFSLLYPNDKNSEVKENQKVKIIPLASQIENKKYMKAFFLGLFQSYSAYKFIDYNNTDQIAKRNTYAWWFLGLYFYGLIDGYVDSNLKDFPDNESNKKEKN